MNVVLFPEAGYCGRLWQPAPNDWHKPMVELRRQLEAKGHRCMSFPDETSGVDFASCAAIYFDIPAYETPVVAKSLLVILEPPIVHPRTYERIHGWPMARVLTFAKGYVDDKHVFYSPYPVVRYTKDLSDVKRDGYICAITSGNKRFDGGLYDARRQSYLSWGKDLDLYGWGWEQDVEMMNTVNFRGPCEDKVRTLAKYRFAIVFENHIIAGYNSEKLYDCLQAGTTPLYRGSRDGVLPLDEVCEDKWAARVIGHLEAIL